MWRVGKPQAAPPLLPAPIELHRLLSGHVPKNGVGENQGAARDLSRDLDSHETAPVR